jgi:hypothetical protein
MIWIFCDFAILSPFWNITIQYRTLIYKSSSDTPIKDKRLSDGGRYVGEPLVLSLSCHSRAGKSNHWFSLKESMAEAIDTAPKAKATSGSPQRATKTASAPVRLETTAVQIMFKFFNLMTSFFCRGEFYLADEQTGHAR